MADLSHWWGNDLLLDETGDLQTITGYNEDNQHIFRRLCTYGRLTGAHQAEYIWEPAYGGSAPYYVGRAPHPLTLAGLIRAQMYMEASVSHSPEPNIVCTINPNGTFLAVIQYVNKNIGEKVPPLQISLG